MMLHIDPARMKTWLGDPPRAAPPEVPGFVLFSHERLNIVTGSIAGFVLLPIWAFIIVGLVGALGGRWEYSASFTPGVFALGAFLALLLVPFLHELVHGIAAIACGVKPAYGVGPGVAFTTFREPLRRVPYLAVGLAPLLAITAACVVLALSYDSIAGWFIFFAVVNAGGAIGDLWMSWRIVRQPRSAIYYDLADGFAVLVPQDNSAALTKQPISNSAWRKET